MNSTSLQGGSSKPPRRSRIIQSAALWAAPLLLLLGLAACDQAVPGPTVAAEPAKPTPALTVGVTAAEPRSLDRLVTGTGSVVAWEELALAAEASGLRVTEVLVEEGARVTKGQLLVRLDDAVLQARRRQFEGSIREAEASLANAQSDFKRATELAPNRIIAEQAVDQRRTLVRTSEAKLAVARAQLDELNEQIAQTRIVAPTDGVVSARAVTLGNVVSPGAELLRIVRDNRLELDAEIPELELGFVRPGQPVRVIHGSTTVDAKVRAVAPTVDPKTRLGTVNIALPRDVPLRPGMFARAEIQVGAALSLAVPQDAIVFRDGRPNVFAVVEDSRAQLRPLETGVRQNGWVEVRSGLEESQRIVVSGAGFLNDGDLVRVDQTASAAPAPAR